MIVTSLNTLSRYNFSQTQRSSALKFAVMMMMMMMTAAVAIMYVVLLCAVIVHTLTRSTLGHI